MTSPRRTAIVHEWFTSMRGGEKCVEALCELYPEADLFALLHVPGSASPIIERRGVRTSFIQHLPFASKRYRNYLPLFPAAVRQFDLSGYDLVISSSHCAAKGVVVPAGALHVCYCYTPMRYLWVQREEYFGPGRAGLLTRIGFRAVEPYLRRWDLRTAANPHHYIAISENVRERIEAIYHRTADVIYPPVDTGAFPLADRRGRYFLIVSALVPYKRVDLAVEAFNRIGERLIVVGSGPELDRLRAIAKPNVEFAGWQPDARLPGYYGGCSAVIFPGEEDFGIGPVEAMASGKPVIALARGGALETVREAGAVRTGILFRDPTPESLIEAIGRYRRTAFDPAAMREFAKEFDRGVFKSRIGEYVERRWQEFRALRPQTSAREEVTAFQR